MRSSGRKRKSRRKTLRQKFVSNGDLCVYCKCKLTAENVSVEHIKPEALGGTLRNDNVVGACKNCNHLNGGILGCRLTFLRVEKEYLKAERELNFLKLFKFVFPKAYALANKNTKNLKKKLDSKQMGLIEAISKCKHYAGYKITNEQL